MTVAVVPTCSCGTVKEKVIGQTGADYVSICPNCDTIQDRQVFGMERVMTKQDIRFEMAWLKRMEEYEDNRPNKQSTGYVEPDDDTIS